MAIRIRTSHTTAKHADVDITKPVPLNKLMADTTAQDCYSYEWEPDNKMCAMCASIDMCGILFNARQEKHIKQLEVEKGGYLDNMHFDSIDRDEVKQLLATKQHTFSQFVKRIQKFTECPDQETCVLWCKSFIKETKGISLKDGIIYVTAR